MTKDQLRSKYKLLRQQLSEEQRDQHSLDIANSTLQLPIWNKTYYHLFLPITRYQEVDTHYILQILQGKDKNVVVSRTDLNSNKLTHVLLTDTTRFRENPWGITEPIDGIPIAEPLIDVVFVPLLVYDGNGHRIGYGKGYYDTFLSACRSNVIKVGVSFFEPETTIFKTFTTDIPLDYCVTPKTIFKF